MKPGVPHRAVFVLVALAYRDPNLVARHILVCGEGADGEGQILVRAKKETLTGSVELFYHCMSLFETRMKHNLRTSPDSDRPLTRNNQQKVGAMIPKKILFCTDFSENSRPAFALAAEYAKAFEAQLLIVHVIDYKDFPGYVDWIEKLREVLDSTEQAVNKRLQSMVQDCAHAVKDVKTYCRRGVTAQEVVALAQEEDVDLIVVGTHGRTGVKHLVMGSVARSVLKTAHRPVLIVEGPSDKGERLGART